MIRSNRRAPRSSSKIKQATNRDYYKKLANQVWDSPAWKRTIILAIDKLFRLEKDARLFDKAFLAALEELGIDPNDRDNVDSYDEAFNLLLRLLRHNFNQAAASKTFILHA